MIQVPYNDEWKILPEYRTVLCLCVKVTGNPVLDCVICKGGGLIGLVPEEVWEDHVDSKTTKLARDIRFEGRPALSGY